MAKYWETIAKKLKADGWDVGWVEATYDGEPGWTAIAIRGKERHSIHANDITLALQELEASCSPLERPEQATERRGHYLGKRSASSPTFRTFKIKANSVSAMMRSPASRLE